MSKSKQPDGWIIPTGENVAHFRKDKMYACKPNRHLRGIKFGQNKLPVEHCDVCSHIVRAMILK